MIVTARTVSFFTVSTSLVAAGTLVLPMVMMMSVVVPLMTFETLLLVHHTIDETAHENRENVLVVLDRLTAHLAKDSLQLLDSVVEL